MTTVYKNETARKNILQTYDRLLEQWRTAYREADLPTAYGDTHVVSFGATEKPALVLFHGVGDDTALMWLLNAKALAGHFCCHAVDTLGGPGKSRPGAAYGKGFDDCAWLDEVFSGLGLGRANLAGVSHGAYLAQLYAARRPARINRVLCMAGSVPAGGGSPIKTMMKIFLPEALFPTRKNTVKLLQKLCGDNFGVFTENPLLLEHFRWLLKGFNNMAMRWHSVESLTPGEVDALRGKTRYLIGEDDPFARLGGKQALLDNRMDARFFPGVGHGINHEMAPEINDCIIRYFLE